MTVEEFSNEFDILMNTYLTQNKIGIHPLFAFDEYEKSIYLTKAQRMYIDEYLLKKGLEFDEESRRLFESLVKQEILNPVYSDINVENNNNYKIKNNSKFYNYDVNSIMRITYESAILTQGDFSQEITVIPIKQDEYNIQRNNPFKKPKGFGLNTVIWRLESSPENINTIELVFPENFTISNYKIRYIKQPSPIILETLSEVSIENETAINNCELNIQCHYKILEMAVSLAFQDRLKFIQK